MAYKHYSPRCKAVYCKSLAEAISLYGEEEAVGGKPCILCESGAASALTAYKTLDLGGTGEEMARRLYALLREGEKGATLLIAVEPTVSGGVMAGVLNRLTRAFGG
ncbi:MAG: hypothetical protein IKD43_05340 [Clostridia bacterium]|nr:hypothetical protein [Clostridia bacterium]